MTTRRVVPILRADDPDDLDALTAQYADLLGLQVVMDHGWIRTLADADGGHQVSLMTRDRSAPVDPQLSVQVDDVEAAYAVARGLGLEIVHGPQDEEWGVRRFLVRDGAGNVVNVLAHRAPR